MKTMKFLTYTVFVMFLGLAISSCTGPAGADGADGADGANGADGADGADGNANVQTYTFDATAWAGSSATVILSAITQDVLDNDVVLHYLSLPGGGVYYPVPGPGENGNHLVRVFDRVSDNTVQFRFMNYDGTNFNIVAGTYETAKVIIIESTNTTSGKSTSSKQAILDELKAAGVDINDYDQVCAYYGI